MSFDTINIYNRDLTNKCIMEILKMITQTATFLFILSPEILIKYTNKLV